MNCPHCGKEFSYESKLDSHLEMCKERVETVKERLNLNPEWEHKVVQKEKDKWENSISADSSVGRESDLDQELNKYGEEGWELINVVPVQSLNMGIATSSRGTTTSLLYVFKRKKSETR